MKMLKKFFVVLLLMAQCIASSAFFTAETEEAEIIHCRQKSANTSSMVMILRQPQSVQIVNCAEALSFAKSIAEQSYGDLCAELSIRGYIDISRSALQLPNNTRYHIDYQGWLTAY